MLLNGINFLERRNIILEPEIFPAATDSRFLREIGIPAIGISAIRNTRNILNLLVAVLLHDHNERLNEQTLLDGIGFYVDVIHGIANLDA